MRIHLEPVVGDLLLTDLRVSDVDRLLDGMLADGAKPGDARHARATLCAALTAAGRAELVDRNVAQLAAPPKVEHAPVR